MSFTNVNQITGFNAAQYNQLLEAAAAKGVTQAQIDKELLAAVSSGQNFTQAIHTVSTLLPKLPPPIMGSETLWQNGLPGLPSFGAAYLAMIGDLAAQQRRQSAEQRALQTEITVHTIEDQAKELREKAIVQLCVGIATGLVSIAQGSISMYMMGSGLKTNAKITDAGARTQADMLLNTKVSSFNSAMGGVSGMMGSINQAVGGFYDSSIKLMDADIERARAQTDALKSLEDALRELIQKMLSTMDAIQQNTNQTRTKILG